MLIKQSKPWKKEVGEILEFEDFKVEYLGKKDLNVPKGFKMVKTGFKFKIFNDLDSVEIVWSAGTGLLMPAKFKFNDKEYSLFPKGDIIEINEIA